MTTTASIVRCVEQAFLSATDIPMTSNSDAAERARATSLAYSWTALEELTAMARADDVAAYMTVCQIQDPAALRWFAMSAVRELADTGWTPAWPEDNESTEGN